jgi:hypothetical protein
MSGLPLGKLDKELRILRVRRAISTQARQSPCLGRNLKEKPWNTLTPNGVRQRPTTKRRPNISRLRKGHRVASLTGSGPSTSQKRRSKMRSVNRFGLVSNAPGMKFFDNPVRMVTDQHDKLTQLLTEYATAKESIENDNTLSPTGKLKKLEPSTAQFLIHINHMKKNPEFNVLGIEEARKELSTERPTTGDKLTDHLRAQEIRQVLASMDKPSRLNVVLNSGNAELLYAVREAPLPLADVSLAEVEKAFTRIAESAKPEVADRLGDLIAIEETVKVNFDTAESYINNPQTMAA